LDRTERARYDDERDARVVNATSGAAFLFGVNVREPIARRRIGYLPELTYYYKFLTAEECCAFMPEFSESEAWKLSNALTRC